MSPRLRRARTSSGATLKKIKTSYFDKRWVPESVKAEIEDRPTVDLMHNGYCGPSQDIMGSSKSSLRLFYYFLPKAFWRQVASQMNLYCCQTLEVRLDKSVGNEGSLTHRTQRRTFGRVMSRDLFREIS
ncbi:hypothetical protein PHMEG_00032070, partial [Phytophthora megakarya]